MPQDQQTGEWSTPKYCRLHDLPMEYDAWGLEKWYCPEWHEDGNEESYRRRKAQEKSSEARLERRNKMLSIQQKMEDRVFDMIAEYDPEDIEAEAKQIVKEILDLLAFSSALPQESGWYWCYGNTYQNKKKLYMLEVEIGSDGIIYAYNANSRYYPESTDLWAKALVPQIPSEE